MEIQTREYRVLGSWCQSQGWGAVIAHAVVSRVLDGEALCAVRGGELVGGVIFGPAYGVFHAQGDWLFAHNQDVAKALVLEWLRSKRRSSTLLGSARWADVVRRGVPDLESFGWDEVWVADHRARSSAYSGDVVEGTGPEGVFWVSEEAWEWGWVPDEFGMYLTRSDVRAGMKFAACMHQGELVAMAEADLETAQAASIQQVFTREQHRRKGYGARVVSALVQTLHRDGMSATYHVDRDNTASIALARGLGFVQAERLFWVSRPVE